MTNQSISHSKPIFCKGMTRSEYNKQYRIANRERVAEGKKRYYRSKRGLISTIYSSQKQSAKHRGHQMPSYTLEQLADWVFNQPNFEYLYANWVDSGFDSRKKPSCDRIDDYAPYMLGNLRLVTWGENNSRSWEDTKSGINNKRSKPVLQITREGIVVEEYYSISNAGREAGVRFTAISACCNGERRTAGGFVWCFA